MRIARFSPAKEISVSPLYGVIDENQMISVLVGIQYIHQLHLPAKN